MPTKSSTTPIIIYQKRFIVSRYREVKSKDVGVPKRKNSVLPKSTRLLLPDAILLPNRAQKLYAMKDVLSLSIHKIKAVWIRLLHVYATNLTQDLILNRHGSGQWSNIFGYYIVPITLYLG